MSRGGSTAAALVLMVSIGARCATAHAAGQGSSPPIEKATLSVGERSYRLDVCTSGGLQHFLGVDLADPKTGASARLAIDPIDGPRIRIVLRPGSADENFVFTPSQCSQLDAEVSPTNWVVNTVRAVSGHVNAECRTPSGQPVSLHARFSRCH